MSALAATQRASLKRAARCVAAQVDIPYIEDYSRDSSIPSNMGLLLLSSVLFALLMIDSCRASPTRNLVCSDLLNLYKKMPDLIRSIDPNECRKTMPNCLLVNSLILEKARERTNQLRKRLGCFPSAPELVVYDQDEVCSLIESAPLYSTKLVKGFGDSPLGALSKEISSAFEPLIDEELSPIYKRLACEFRETDTAK